MSVVCVRASRAAALSRDGAALPPRLLAAGALATVLALASTSLAQARGAPESFADLAERVSPAVVHIATEQSRMAAIEGMPDAPLGPDHPFFDQFKRFFGEGPQAPEGRPAAGVGSGFLIDAEGYLVTNNHVIEDASSITVTLKSGETLEADLIGRDEKTDLALLKVESDEALPFVSFGDAEAVRPGDWVMAVGSPFGLGGTVTAGIVSARGRDLPGGTLIDFLQIDAAINRGNSGGPAFNLDGEVIGVNTAIFSPNGGSVGIGFAIPADLAEIVIADLRDDGRVERGWLGVRIQEVTPEIAEGFGLAQARGALVAAVEADSPAAAAGVVAGDIILDWDGQAVEAMRNLPRLVAATPTDKDVSVTLWRDGQQENLSVTTGRLPGSERLAATEPSEAPASDQVVLADSGLAIGELTAAVRQALAIEEALAGVVIVAVEPGSVAAEQGLRQGDVITSIAQQAVTSVADAEAAYDSQREAGRKQVAILASRDGAARFVALPIGT